MSSNEPTESKVPCTWCLNGYRKSWVSGGHVVLFACVREHMTARPLCADCATCLANVGDVYVCKDCANGGVDYDEAICQITLVTTREDWMDQINAGRIRMLTRS